MNGAAKLTASAFGGTLLLAAACGQESTVPAALFRAEPVPNVVDGVVWEAGNWEPHLAAGSAGVSWGNHRAVVEVEPGAGEALLVRIPWRRQDPAPERKAVVVVDASTGDALEDVHALRVEGPSGDVVFRPNPDSDLYHVYYMPWQSTGGYYPTITYPTQGEIQGSVEASGEGEVVSRAQVQGPASLSWVGKAPAPDPSWLASVRDTPPEDFPRGRTTRIQSVDEFHSFFPMEVAATPEEAADFRSRSADGWALVPEHRDRPIRMKRHVPLHWVAREDLGRFESRALPGESFAFQLGVVAGGEPLEGLEVTFEGFPEEWSGSLTCLNCGGVSERGIEFLKEVEVEPGEVQPLWIGLSVPEDQRPGRYDGTVTVSTVGNGDKTVEVSLEVSPGLATNHGFDEPDLQTRLAWLNSTVGTDPDFIIEPFRPVEIDDREIRILGRTIRLAPSGLPDQIFSHFTPELTGLAEEPEPLLAAPLQLRVIGRDGVPVALEPLGFRVRQESRGRASWLAENRGEGVLVRVEGALEYDGMLDYRLAVIAEGDLELDDIRLPVSLVPDGATWMLGLGYRGGRRPESVDWSWKIENHQEGVWLGGIHKGLQWVLRDENYVRPLNTNFYQNQPLNLPPSWYNGGRGGIRIREGEGAVTAVNYSGPRTLAEGDTLHFNVRFLVTPFKPIDTGEHFRTRFVHQYVPVDSVRAWGGTVVNIHHANEINPYINYPFFNLDLQTAYIREAHEKGIKVKLYNTIRELTYRAHELFALRSLGDEILNDGEGGGHSWMQEHLEGDYHSAWHAWRVDDAAMLNKGTSRWTNYYIEGLNWLAENQEIDGLYLDDIAFSRATVKRLVSVLHRHRDEVVIDLHSANQFNPRDGFINSAMLYMEHFPFISRLWFGEYFEYDRDEDYWLTEVSGLPFGLMGEMLQDGGRPYRGMLYGMTARKYGEVDPRPVWRMMNDFGIAESRMMGYWLEDPPVRTDHPRVLATTYVHPEGRTLVALASWADSDVTVSLDVDALLGQGVADQAARSPAVEGLQEAARIDLSRVRVPANGGLWIVMEPATNASREEE